MLGDDYRGPVPLYVVLAAILREQIIDGTLPEGAATPSEPSLAAEYGVSNETASKAVALLREGGWVVTQRSRGSRVLLVPPPRVITAQAGAVITARLALPGDEPGSEVTLVVSQPDGRTESGPAGRVVIQAG